MRNNIIKKKTRLYLAEAVHTITLMRDIELKEKLIIGVTYQAHGV